MKYKFFILICLLVFTNCKKTTTIKQEVKPFYIVGISITSTNENGKSVEDMGKLWGRFFSEGVTEKVSNRLSEDIYSVFTEYKSDYTEQYTAIIGHKISSLENISNGFTTKQIRGGNYKRIVAKGEMPDAIVKAWKEIWSKDKELKRRYTTDFEV